VTPEIGAAMNGIILLALFTANWFLPRKAGLIGFIFLPLICLFGFALMAFIALESGMWKGYDGLEAFWILIWGTGFFVVTLPISLFAMSRFAQAQSKS
jgi:hypothetical protein